MSSSQFQRVWLPLQERFYRIAFYILESDADARDAVQDLYLKLWNLRDQLEIVRNPSAYGSLLLKNLCIDRIRRRQSVRELSEEDLSTAPPDEALLQREELQAVSRAIDQLPPGQRKLLSLRLVQGLSYQEIEKETGLSGLNIRVQVSLARKKLKQLL